ncbi:alpha/beta fold hydrolase [Leifsonia sp. NPDC058248]|uniref:alpha/beta fold hydrolase n=1 Tax=Leifsonia sp. NPDC058248 TaxID=3346402 RepID=UPI0036DEC630
MYAVLNDGSSIPLDIAGAGPALLLPVNPAPADAATAETLRAWGMDPELGRTLIDGLSDRHTVIAFDYEGHLAEHPQPTTLTPDNLAADLIAVADAAGADRFAYYGYSWLALAGLQLAVRTDRLTALAMGGFPPIDGPYAEMFAVTRATHALAVENAEHPEPVATDQQDTPGEDFDWDSVPVTLSPAQTQQYYTLYSALQEFDDRAVLDRLSIPLLTFAGTADAIDYSEKWGGVHVDIAGPLVRNRAALEANGWQVELLDGLDHTKAMQPNAVLPLLRRFFRG